MMEILFGNFEKDFLFFRNWISVHLQNHLSSIYMRFYQLKQRVLVLLDKILFESLINLFFLLVIKIKENFFDLRDLLCCRTVTHLFFFYYFPCLTRIIFLFSDTYVSFLSMQNQIIIFLFVCCFFFLS
jgi:hypothetical protein